MAGSESYTLEIAFLVQSQGLSNECHSRREQRPWHWTPFSTDQPGHLSWHYPLIYQTWEAMSMCFLSKNLFPWGRLALLGGCWLGREFFAPERSPLSASWIWNLFNEKKYPHTVSQWDICRMIFMLERFICQIWKQAFLPQMMLTLPRKLKIL